MSGKVPPHLRAAKFVGRFAATRRVGFAPSDESIARVAELAGRYVALRKWGVRDKLPATKETQADLDRFFAAGREGKLDVTEIVGVTSDIRRLEMLAEEYDAARNVTNPFKAKRLETTFDIERAAEGLKAAKNVVEASVAAQETAKDATKDAFALVRDAAKVVPLWAWVAAAGGLTLYVIAQVATVIKAFRR